MSGDDNPHYHGHRDRLRARFLDVGGDALPDYELLELVLFRSIPRRDVKPIAKELMKRFGTFAEVLAASPTRLMEVEGIGESVVTDLKVVEASARRLAKGEVAKRPVLSSWTSVINYCRAAMAFMDKEQFRLLFLDKRNALIADEFSNRAQSIMPRSIRARSSSGPWNSRPRPWSSSTTTRPVIRPPPRRISR